MRYKLLLAICGALTLGSCSTYRAGQTPDDVYYSPAKASVARAQSDDRYEDYVSHEDDQYLRMKVQNRELWGSIDDYDYWNDSRYVPYYSYNPYGTMYWNTWNPLYPTYSYYNYNMPYFGYNNYNYYGYGYSYYPYVYGGKATATYITKRPPNVGRPSLSSYSNRNYNLNSTRGSVLRVLSPNTNSYNTRSYNNNNNNSYTAPTRSYTPASSGGYSGGGSSSGGGVSRPARGGH